MMIRVQHSDFLKGDHSFDPLQQSCEGIRAFYPIYTWDKRDLINA